MSAMWIWEPGREWTEQTNVWRFMRKLGFDDRESFLSWSVAEPEAFWDAIVREMNVEWGRPYGRVLDKSAGPEWARWFEGGELNIVANCLDRHALQMPGKIALRWEEENGNGGVVRWSELSRNVDRVAGGLRELGLVPGDRVALVMPMWPEIVEILYACLKLGLIAVPVFAGFGTGAIATRMADSSASVVFTADHLVRRGKPIPLLEKVREAVAKAETGAQLLEVRGEWWQSLKPGLLKTRMLPSETAALLLYTSGTTGKPKGVVHTHAGALVQTAKEIYLGFDHKPDDRFFWLSDIGWMMGPWTILGNHHFGGEIFLYDGAPDYPDPDRLWQMTDHHRITAFGVSPTAIRMLMRTSHPDRFPMAALRILGSTGEPWDDVSYRWFFEQAGKRRCPIINISGGTEIVGSFLFPLPIQKIKSCSLGSPAPGMDVDVVDDNGDPVRGRMGYLVCKAPAPSMTRGIWNAPQRYIDTYWSRWTGWWNHGDWASVDEDGCWFLHGRADESMNVAGRKVGPAEVEEVLMEHPAVSEAAVIGAPDDTKGEAIVCFVILRPGSQVAMSALSAHVAAEMGSAFRPRTVIQVAELPKTQSGKIVRRLIRLQYLGEDLGDASTVANSAALLSIPRFGQ